MSDEREWEPTRWWRAVDPDGLLWCESSDETDVRFFSRPTDRIFRLWREKPREEWREADVSTPPLPPSIAP